MTDFVKFVAFIPKMYKKDIVFQNLISLVVEICLSIYWPYMKLFFSIVFENYLTKISVFIYLLKFKNDVGVQQIKQALNIQLIIDKLMTKYKNWKLHNYQRFPILHCNKIVLRFLNIHFIGTYIDFVINRLNHNSIPGQ